MSVDLSGQQEPTISVITTVPVAQNGGEMDALLLGRIGVSVPRINCVARITRVTHTAHTTLSSEQTETPHRKTLAISSFPLWLSDKVRDVLLQKTKKNIRNLRIPLQNNV